MDANIRILVVDDEPDIRQLLRILLENRSYQVAEASSGEEAVRRSVDRSCS
ncbi:MAG: response regulator [Oscillospiraceae bacterium]